MKVELSMSRLLDNMKPEERKDFYDWVSLEDEVIENVVTQLVTGFTKVQSCGHYSCGDDKYTLLFPTALDVGLRFVRECANTTVAHENREMRADMVTKIGHIKTLDEKITCLKLNIDEYKSELNAAKVAATKLCVALKMLRDVVAKEPAMNNQKYDTVGAVVHKALQETEAYNV